MSFFIQPSVIQAKRWGLGLLLVGGCSAAAFAQSAGGLPTLPALPSLPSVPSAPATLTQPAPTTVGDTAKAAGAAPAQEAPAKDRVLSPDMLATKAKIDAAQKDVLAKPPAPPAPAGPEAAEIASEAQAQKQVLSTLPALPAPNMEVPMVPMGGGGAADGLATTTLPSIDVFGDKPKVKTWLATKLAPTVVPISVNFNYKRVVLPDVIYRTAYDRENLHLPRRMTREDYANLLFTSVAHNDTEATRALLNAGTGLEVTNANGETPLAVAQRTGAVEVAALLQARGAK